MEEELESVAMGEWDARVSRLPVVADTLVHGGVGGNAPRSVPIGVWPSLVFALAVSAETAAMQRPAHLLVTVSSGQADRAESVARDAANAAAPQPIRIVRVR